MADVYVVGDSIVSSLGFSSDENLGNIINGIGGIKTCTDKSLSPEAFPASQVDDQRLIKKFQALNPEKEYTRFEQLLIVSMHDALSKTSIDPTSEETLFVISTTKGNIDLHDKEKKKAYDPERIHLWAAAAEVGAFFKNPNTPVVISNACISGVLAIVTAAGLIRQGQYKNAIVAGADILSHFVVSGFQSFLSLSPQPCRPFDKNRDGLSLGEGAGCIVLSNDAGNKSKITVAGGSCNNDANHISGPSRTGEGLYLAIKQALKSTGIDPGEVGFISAHGTATPFNDEMESISIARHNMHNIPVNSMKGYWGHTLGAAGIIETVAAIHSLRNNILIPTKGYSEHGVSEPIRVISELSEKKLTNCLKIASGFGGCNAALILQKK
ncbi:MAG: hypothetical protein K9H64_21645 [Bacteroidales bacterium]|nr:hypothetical protein [Bacteroidales bacterium]MCF8458654.1 hypothetical protein [Bacteroidales bacterium]